MARRYVSLNKAFRTSTRVNQMLSKIKASTQTEENISKAVDKWWEKEGKHAPNAKRSSATVDAVWYWVSYEAADECEALITKVIEAEEQKKAVEREERKQQLIREAGADIMTEAYWAQRVRETNIHDIWPENMLHLLKGVK